MVNGQLFNIYECNECALTFAVEQAFDELHVINCPVCSDDEFIGDVGSGEMKRF